MPEAYNHLLLEQKWLHGSPEPGYPEDLVRDYGYDSLYMYSRAESGGNPPPDGFRDEDTLYGNWRFIRRFWRLALCSLSQDTEAAEELPGIRSGIVREFRKYFDKKRYHSALAVLMKGYRRLSRTKTGTADRETIRIFARMLAEFAPCTASEIWERCGEKTDLYETALPETEPGTEPEIFSLPVQVNGILRAEIQVPRFSGREELIRSGREAAEKWITREPDRVIYIPGRILNFVQE